MSENRTRSVKALLDLYERGNNKGHVSHSVIEEEVEILRGFVRSKMNNYEKLSKNTEKIQVNYDPTGSYKKATRKDFENKVKIPNPQLTNVGKDEVNEQKPKDQIEQKIDVHSKDELIEKKTESILIENQDQDQSQSQNQNQNKDQNIETVQDEDQIQSQGQELQNQESKIQITQTETSKRNELYSPRRKPAEFERDVSSTPDQWEKAIEQMKQRAVTEENLKVVKLQRKLTKVLSENVHENNFENVQKLIADALEKDDEEEDVCFLFFSFLFFKKTLIFHLKF